MSSDDSRRSLLLGFLSGAIAVVTILVSVFAYFALVDADDVMPPELRVQRVNATADALALDMHRTRAEARVLSVTLDAAWNLGEARAPLTANELRLVHTHLVAEAARQGRTDEPSVVVWRGEAFRVSGPGDHDAATFSPGAADG
jgi:hypothetical protein